jgi:hypothetical protein
MKCVPNPLVKCGLCLWRLGLGYDRISRLMFRTTKLRHRIYKWRKYHHWPEHGDAWKLWTDPRRRQKPPIPDPSIKISRILASKKRLRRVKYLRRMVWRWLFVYQSSPTTVAIIGCSKQHFKAHIQSQFTKSMSWENYGSVWELDHKIPCRMFDLSDPNEIKRCFHYSNYQPMPYRQNRSKSDKNLHPQQSLLLNLS